MKKINHFVQFIIIKFIFFIFEVIGYRASSNLGFIIGKFIGPLFRSKSLIIQNLKKANFNNDFNLNQIADNILGNYGRIFAEYVHLKNFRNNNLNKYISIDGYKYLDQIKKSKKKIVFVSGHFNNFELMAMEIEKSGINLAAIYRPLNNFFLNKIMVHLRKKFICKNQLIKGISGVRDSFKLFKKGFSLALMIDQRLSEGIKTSFFGKNASTTTLPAQFVTKFKAEIVPIYIYRSENFKFKMKINEPLPFKENETMEDITLKLNIWIENQIIKNPEQWIWSHDRWK